MDKKLFFYIISVTQRVYGCSSGTIDQNLDQYFKIAFGLCSIFDPKLKSWSKK